jgi:hypothetical protein
MKIEVKIILQRLCLYLRPYLHPSQLIQINLSIFLDKYLAQHLLVIKISQDIMKDLSVVYDELSTFRWRCIEIYVRKGLVYFRCQDAV